MFQTVLYSSEKKKKKKRHKEHKRALMLLAMFRLLLEEHTDVMKKGYTSLLLNSQKTLSPHFLHPYVTQLSSLCHNWSFFLLLHIIPSKTKYSNSSVG